VAFALKSRHACLMALVNLRPAQNCSRPVIVKFLQDVHCGESRVFQTTDRWARCLQEWASEQRMWSR